MSRRVRQRREVRVVAGMQIDGLRSESSRADSQTHQHCF